MIRTYEERAAEAAPPTPPPPPPEKIKGGEAAEEEEGGAAATTTTTAATNDGAPEPGRVSEVRREWIVRTDEQYAHRLHDEEITYHLSGNKHRNEQIRESIPTAIAVQKEDQIVLEKELEKKKLAMEEDSKIAMALQKKILLADKKKTKNNKEDESDPNPIAVPPRPTLPKKNEVYSYENGQDTGPPYDRPSTSAHSNGAVRKFFNVRVERIPPEDVQPASASYPYGLAPRSISEYMDYLPPECIKHSIGQFHSTNGAVPKNINIYEFHKIPGDTRRFLRHRSSTGQPSAAETVAPEPAARMSSSRTSSGVPVKHLPQGRRRMIQKTEEDIIAHAETNFRNVRSAANTGSDEQRPSPHLQYVEMSSGPSVSGSTSSYTCLRNDANDNLEEINQLEKALGIPREKLYEEQKRLLQEEKDAEIARMMNANEEILETRDCELACRIQNKEIERYRKYTETRKTRHQPKNTSGLVPDTYFHPRDIIRANYNGDGEDGESHYMEVLADNTPGGLIDRSQSSSQHYYRAPPATPLYTGRPRLAEPFPPRADPNEIDNLGPVDDANNSLPKRATKKKKKIWPFNRC